MASRVTKFSNLKEFLFKLDIIAPAISLVFLIIPFIIRKREFSFSDYILIGFLFVELVLNSIAALLQSRSINNLPIYFLNCFIIHTVFSYYFFKILYRKQFVLIGFVFFLIAFAFFFKIQPYNTFPSYLYAIASFIMILYSLIFLNQFIDTPSAYEILSLKEFWIVVGTLTYFGSSFFIFISYNYLSIVSPKKVYILWQSHNIFLFLGCCIFLKSINSNKWILK